MLYEWIVLFEAVNRKSARRPADPLGDPLDRLEWQGLGWFNRLVAATRRRPTHRTAQRHEAPATDETRIPLCPAQAAA